MPRVRDTSDSFYRRQLFIPFTKCFTGAERKYIKNDYLHRKEVLEYVLYKVLMMDSYYTLEAPQRCQLALEEYKEYNDPVRQFVSEILPELKWNYAPFPFLYDLYNAWYKKNVGDRQVVSRQKFIRSLLAAINKSNTWVCRDKNKTRRIRQDMYSVPEPLIATYHLTEWMNPMYTNSHDDNKRCIPRWKSTYKGISRIGGQYDN